MLRTLALVLLARPIASAQIIVPNLNFFPPHLKNYLALTDDQVAAITDLNNKLNAFRLTKQQRQGQVQLELAQETAKPTLDPMALGLRYVELEAIRREIQAEQQKTSVAAEKILNESQKTKLTALQQAMQLYPTACSAVDQNLVQGANTASGWISTNRFFDPTLGSVASFLLGFPVNSACGSVPTTAFRTGVFTPVNPTP